MRINTDSLDYNSCSCSDLRVFIAGHYLHKNVSCESIFHVLVTPSWESPKQSVFYENPELWIYYRRLADSIRLTCRKFERPWSSLVNSRLQNINPSGFKDHPAGDITKSDFCSIHRPHLDISKLYHFVWLLIKRTHYSVKYIFIRPPDKTGLLLTKTRTVQGKYYHTYHSHRYQQSYCYFLLSIFSRIRKRMLEFLRCPWINTSNKPILRRFLTSHVHNVDLGNNRLHQSTLIVCDYFLKYFLWTVNIRLPQAKDRSHRYVKILCNDFWRKSKSRKPINGTALYLLLSIFSKYVNIILPKKFFSSEESSQFYRKTHFLFSKHITDSFMTTWSRWSRTNGFITQFSFNTGCRTLLKIGRAT